ncbi:OmpA family protein [Aeromicrobium sp.]|uniref:OmpA family protein n=1 Tax=Aeromicrobium sp. TaxID=1871063 RepID=UPI003C530C0D
MSDKRLKSLAAFVAAMLVGVIVIGALVGARSTAADLRSASERALMAAGLSGVAVQFRGREAEISGGTPRDLTTARVVVATVDGVRRVDVVRAAPRRALPTPVARLDLARTATGVTLLGAVPDPDAAAGIKVAVAEIFAVRVKGDLTIDRNLGAASWVDRIPELLGELAGVKRLRLRVDGSGTITVSGSIESAAGVDRIRRRVRSTVPDLRLLNRLDVVPGGLSTIDATVLNVSALIFSGRGSTLNKDHARTLDAVADVLRRNQRVDLVVASDTGPMDVIANARLGLARAAAVKERLVQEGVAADRIDVRVYGSDPRSPADPEGAQLRRVEFIVKRG